MAKSRKKRKNLDNRTEMQKTWDYILTVLNLICLTDNLF